MRHVVIALLIGALWASATDIKVVFAPLSVAKTADQQSTFRLSKELAVITPKGKKVYPLSYEVLLKSGDTVKDSAYPFGTILNAQGKPIKSRDGSLHISTSQDSNSLLKAGDDYYLITHFEEGAGAMSATKLAVEKGILKAVKTQSIDFSSIDGINNVCAGSKTPWNSHIGGEESSMDGIYDDPQSFLYQDCNDVRFATSSLCKNKNRMQNYLGTTKKVNIYNYGYMVQTSIDTDGTKVSRHYVTGKYSPEMAVVAKDNKTLYISDDNGKNSVLFKLVLDKPLNAHDTNWEGTLYAAQLHSTNHTQAYDITWIKLGHASDKELKNIIDTRPRFTNFFALSKTPKEGYKKIVNDGDVFYVKLKEFKASQHFKDKKSFMQGVAFLETRVYAAYLGATYDLQKEEGVAYDAKNNTIYVAFTSLKDNICGGVYALALDENYNASTMQLAVQGKELSKDDKDYNIYKDEYTCHPDYIAHPDNIAYIGNDILLIGEDTKYHINNMLFAYNTQDKTLTRIATLPTGGEVTGLAAGFVHDKKVIFVNTQHPFSDVCRAKNSNSSCNSEILSKGTPEDEKGVIGYINGLPGEVF